MRFGFVPPSCPFGKEARHKDEQRHMEEIYDVKEAAYGRVVVVDGVRHVPHHHKDNEQPLYVVEERDAARARPSLMLHDAPVPPGKTTAF